MSNIRGLHEILTNRYWDMIPDALHAYKEVIDNNLAFRVPLSFEKEEATLPFFTSSRAGFQDKVYVGRAKWIAWDEELEDDDKIINVIGVNGPITRNGGACSYGSKELRDILMQAADMEHVIGHIIYIDTPGGSSQSKYDFEQAIDYIHEKGQKVVALVDGMACSAGYALASMCDEIYFMNPANEVGCIGTMCAFYIQRHGDENEQTHERYIELYAEGSPYKNREFREAADGNYEGLLEELNRSAEDFKAMVRKNRPNVTDEQLLGDTYEAGKVVGSLVDGIGTMQTCIDRILELNGLEVAPKKDPVPAPAAEPEEDPEADSTETIDNENTNQNQKEMSKEYSKIMAALGANALESDKENALYLNEEQCDALENHLGECENKGNALDAKMTEIASLNSMIEQLKKDNQANIDALEADHAATVEKLNAEHAEAVNALNDEHNKAIETLNEQVKELSDKLAAANADIEAKNAEIETLSNQPVEEPKPAEAPADNGIGAAKEDFNLVCKPGMTAKERREALAKKYGRPNC